VRCEVETGRRTKRGVGAEMERRKIVRGERRRGGEDETGEVD